MFKIETHLHTLYTSACAIISAEQIVEGYLAAGYSGLIVTDHFSRDTFRHLNMDTTAGQDKVEAFLTGYRMVRQEGEKRGLKVYRGAEVRFDGRWNDYLLYGFSDELLRDPEAVFTMGVEAFYKKCRAEGALLIHAHPYRNGGSPTTAAALDGVEVCNANYDHEERNDLALAFARKYGLIQTAGSDCHGPKQVGMGGIAVERLPEDERGLVALLRSGNYQVFETGRENHV